MYFLGIFIYLTLFIGEIIEGETCPSALRQELAVRQLRDEVTGALVPELHSTSRYGVTLGVYGFSNQNFNEYSANIDRITGIELYRSNNYQYVGLQVTYLMMDGNTQQGGARGNYQNQRFPYTLSDGEFFVRLDGAIDSGRSFISNLTLVTNYGIKHSVVADPTIQGQTFSIDGGNEIVSIYGNVYNGYLRNIGLYYRVCQLCRRPGH